MHCWHLADAETVLILTIEQGWIIFSLLIVTDSPKKKKKSIYCMLLTQGRELWVFLFWILFLDIIKMFHPLYFEIKNGERYLYLNRILQQMKILYE